MDKEQARRLYELADRLSKLDVNTLSEEQLAERTAMIARLQEVKQRLDPKCWDGYKKQGTKIKGGVRVNNCVPESIEQDVAEAELDEKWSQKYKDSIDCNHPKGFSQKAHCASKNESIEEANGEYDDEAGMAESNLHTMARAVAGLIKTIEDNDNLPEWAQEKIAKAEMMITSVWDYLLSQKEQGVDPKVEGVAEAKKPSPKLTPVNIKKTDPVSEEINTEAYERLQKVFAFKNYES